MTSSQINELIITPAFKNSHRANVNLTVTFSISAIGYKQYKQTFTLASFKQIDVKKILSELGIPSERQVKCRIEVFNNGTSISSQYFSIK